MGGLGCFFCPPVECDHCKEQLTCVSTSLGKLLHRAMFRLKASQAIWASRLRKQTLSRILRSSLKLDQMHGFTPTENPSHSFISNILKCFGRGD